MLKIPGLAAVALILAGCSAPSSAPPTAGPEVQASAELDHASDRPCPRTLPVGDDPSGHGFGSTEAATELPVLPPAEKAWVCEYVPVHFNSATGTVYSWVRDRPAEPVAGSDLPALRESLDGLALPDASQACTADLGPRWMVVSAHDGDLTGVVVDGYGCGEVRLTDDPDETAPGAGSEQGTVAGVLAGGPEVLDALHLGR